MATQPKTTGRHTGTDLRDLPPVVPLWPTAGQAWGLSRWATYDLHARGELPFRVVKLGRSLRVTRADLLRSLGETEQVSA